MLKHAASFKLLANQSLKVTIVSLSSKKQLNILEKMF